MNDVARPLEGAVRPEIDVAAGFREAQLVERVDLAGALLVQRPVPMHVRAHHEAALRLANGRRHHVPPVHRAECLQRVIVAFDAAGRAHRRIADLVEVPFEQEGEAIAGLADQLVGPHVRRRRIGGAGVELDDLVGALAGHVDLHGAEAADAAHLRIDDALHEGGGDCRIDRVAAALQDGRSRLGRFRLRRDDHRVLHGADRFAASTSARKLLTWSSTLTRSCDTPGRRSRRTSTPILSNEALRAFRRSGRVRPASLAPSIQ